MSCIVDQPKKQRIKHTDGLPSRVGLALLRRLCSSSASCRVCALGVGRSVTFDGGTEVSIGAVNAAENR